MTPWLWGASCGSWPRRWGNIPRRARRRELHRHLLGAYRELRNRLGARTDALLDAVEQILVHRHRASSAIEGFDAALRPFLSVHKGVTQGSLELFRAYFNLRTRRWGRHKGTSAQGCLTGEPIADWLTVLAYPRSTALS